MTQIAKGWYDFQANVIVPGTSQEDAIVLKGAFYSGVATVLMAIIDEQADMNVLLNECKIFAAEESDVPTTSH